MHFRNAALAMFKGQKSLLRLENEFCRLAEQIQFLGHLCKVDDGDPVQPGLPMGIELLCYLFDRTLHVNAKDLYFVLISILRSSAAPYFK